MVTSTHTIEWLNANQGADGEISLREAIIAANNTNGYLTRFHFDITGTGPDTINIISALPDITDTIVIDGWSEPDHITTPIIELKGDGVVLDGLVLSTGSDGSTIRGLIINRFASDGIEISSNTNTIVGNIIGTDANDTLNIGNDDGIQITGNNNIIGGTDVADRNIISGNDDDGISISAIASGTIIQGNYIGLNSLGDTALGNKDMGIHVRGSNTIIGGTVDGAENIISGNTKAGIAFENSHNNTIQGNYIGTDAAGTGDINGTTATNGQSGIVIDLGSTGNLVGTNADGTDDIKERNVISGNNWYGVELLGSTTSNNTVAGNYIGTDKTGLVALGNSQGGVSFWDSANNNIVGGGLAGEGNVISGNGEGILIAKGSSTNKVQGNYIGLGSDGSTEIGNTTGFGIYFERAGSTNLVTGNIIGTDGDGTNDANEGNVISANAQGIVMEDAEVTGNIIAGNYIGTDATGTLDKGNTDHGIYIINSGGHTIGGNGSNEGNLISGNDGSGIAIGGGGADNITIQGNIIGTQIDGTSALGNSEHGLLFSNTAKDSIIGGINTNDANTIVYNSLTGVTVLSGSTGISILGNSIHSNTGIGVDLSSSSVSPDGVSTNDSNDSDSGGNNRQNFPVLTTAIINGGQITINGTVTSTANTHLRIEFYTNTTADSSGYGEGERYLGFVNVTTDDNGDGSGDFTFSKTITDTISSGEFITATATVSNASFDTFTDTSEFAQNVIANIAPVLGNNSLTINEGQTVILDSNDLSATDSDNTDSGLSFTISNVQNGQFERVSNAGIAIFSFTQAEITASDIQFVHDGNEDTPAYQVAVSDGILSTSLASASITFSNVNDAPNLTANALNPTYTENDASAALVFDTAHDSAREIGQSTDELVFTVSNVTQGILESISLDGFSFTLTHGNNGTTVNNSFNYAVSLAGSTATVTMTATASTTKNIFDNLVESLEYKNTSENPTTADRVITITSIKDDGGIANGGSDTTLLNIVSTVSINAVNDTPELSGVNTVFINEIHYDNNGADTGEAVEIAAPAGTDLTGWSLVFYNGADGQKYATSNLSGIVSDLGEGYGVVTIFKSGIEDGDPDGIALVDDTNTVVQFISYDGSFTATDGPANGLTSSDIGVSESDTIPIGQSLQLTGSSPNFSWVAAATNTFGAENTGQSLSQQVTEDNILTFSAGNNNAITISDVDANSSDLQVNLTVTQGTLTLVNISGGINSLLNNGTNNVSFKGSVSEINAAIEGLQYKGNQDYFGNDTLAITVDDQGNTGSGGALNTPGTVAITVTPINDTPVATSNTVIAVEDVPLVIDASDFSFTDVESDSLTSVTITGLTLNGGTLTHTGGSINVTNGMTITAAQLADLTFTSALNDSTDSSFTYTVNDAGTGVATAVMNITVNAVNDVPVATGNTVIAAEDIPLVIDASDFSFTDIESDSLTSVTITDLNLNGGTLTHTGGSVNVTNGMTITAAQLADLTFTSALNDSTDSSFTYTVNDAGTGTASSVMNITVNAVNDVPVATGNTVIAAEDIPLVIDASDFSFTDVESDSLTSVSITGLTLNGGTLTHSGGTVNVTNGMTITAAQLADLTFTSASNDSANSSFTYTVNDVGSGVTSAVMNITVNAINDVPVATGNTVIAAEDVPLIIDSSDFNFTDTENDSLASVTITGLTLNGGTLTHSAGSVAVTNGMTITAAQLADLTFTSALNDSTDSSFIYTVNDASTGITSAVMNITVNAVNDVPVATGNTVIAAEDIPLVIDASDFSFTDVESDSLTSVSITGLTLNGGTLTHSGGTVNVTNGMTITAAQLADLTFTSALNDSTDSSFTYTVNDAGTGTASSVMNITVNAVNDVPVATGNTVIAAEDIPLVIDASDFSFTDVESDSLTSVSITGLTLNGGTLTHSGGTVNVTNGMTITAAQLADLTFTSASNDSANSSFTYTVNDVGSGVTSAVMNITVNAINDVPVATGNTVIAAEDVPLIIDSSDFNFTDTENDSLASVTITGLTLNGGTLTHSAGSVAVTNGMTITAAQLADLTFTSALNDSTDSSFIYTVNDASTGITSAVMNITVNAVNDVPVATGNTVIAAEDIPLVIDASDFSFTDVESDSLTSVSITGLTLNGGTLTHSGGTVNVTNGMTITAAQLADLTFTSALNDSTDSSFTYTVNDAGTGTASSVMNITVNAVNDVPVATGNTVIAAEDIPLVIDASDFSFTDVESDSLTSVSITGLTLNGGTLTHSGGTVNVTNGMTITAAQLADLTFTSASNDSANSSFTYTVNDVGSGVTSAVMNITVNAINDVPVATGNTVIAAEDVPLIIDSSDFNFTDTENDSLASVTITGLTLNGGTLTHSAGSVAVTNGMTITAAQLADLTFTSALNDSTDSSFIYTVNDASTGITSAVMNITVNAVNDVPVATGNTVIAAEDIPLVIDASDFSFTDVESDSLTSVSITGLTLNGGTLTHSGGTVNVTNGMTITAAQLADLTFTSASNDSANSSFTYTVNDVGSGVTSAVMNITVNAINDVPVATGNTVIAAEDVPLIIDSSDFNFTDTENDSLASVTITGLTLNGGTLTHSAGSVAVTNGMTITAAQLADLTFTSALNDSTDSSFTYTVNDAGTGVATAVMNITVNVVNDVPVATGNTVIAAEDIPLVIDASDFSFTDIESDSLTSVSITGLTLNGGTLTHSGGTVNVTNGMTITAAQLADLTFTSASNDSANSSFTYTVNDVGSGVTSAVMNITVNAINDVPVATGNTVIAAEDVPLIIDSSDFNFTDTENDSLASVTITGLTLNGGTLTHSAGSVAVTNGMTITAAQLADLTFTSALNDSTDSSFTYTVNDAGTGVATAVMNITVNAVNDVPVATGNTVIAAEDIPLVIDASDFSFTDIESDSLTSVTITGLNLNGGTLTHTGGSVNVTNGMTITAAQLADLTFTSASNDSADSSFTYTVNDVGSGVTSAVMNITVNAINDVPVATGNTVIAAEDVPLIIDSSDFNFTDTENDSLASVTITGLTLNGGTLTHSAGSVAVTNGMTITAAQLADLTFTSALNDSTDSSFIYTVNDASTGITSAVMNITVNAVNDAPVNTVPGAQSVNEDTPLAISGISVNDVDGNLSTVQVSVSNGNVSVSLSGTASITAGADNSNTLTLSGTQADINIALASLTYQGNLHFNGSDTLTVLSTDSNSATDSKTIAITVNAVNDDPTDINLSNNSVNQSTGINALIGALSGTDVDIGSSHTFSLVVGVGDTNNALFQVSSTSLLANNATTMAAGIYSLRIEIDDNNGGTFEKVFSITIVDDLAPAPTITLDNNITADDIINAAEALGNINISGTVAGEVSDGDTVTLTVNGNTFTGAVNSGTFSIAVTGTDLVADGDSTIDASISHTDTAGNTGSSSDTESYSVNTSAPAAPVITGISNDSGANTTDGITNDNTLLISGTAEARSDVEVFINNISIGTTTANRSGNWNFDHTGTVLADTSAVLTAKATDNAGNTSTASANFNLTVDTVNPVPTITLDNNITADDIINAAEALGSINISGTVAGEVSDGDTVTLTVNGNIFTGAVNSGTFSIAVTGTDLVTDGDSTIDASISHTDIAGNTGSGSDTESYSVDTSAPAAPVITGINNDSDTTIINGVTNDNTLLIVGTAEANNSIEVFIDGISIGIIIPDGSGNWRFDHTDTILADGSYVLTSQATDHAGNSSPTSAGFDIIIDTSTPVTSDETDLTELFGVLPDDENTPVDQAPISSLEEILPPENSDSSIIQNEGETTLQESFNNSLPELSEDFIYEEDKDLYQRAQYESKKFTPFVPQSFASFLKYIHSIDMGSAPDLNGLTMGDDTSVSDDLWKNIELMRSQIDLSEKAGRADSFKVEYVAGASISFTAGIVSWVLRGGSLMASFLSSVPVFRNFDPLPIATSKQKASDDKKNNDDHEQSPQKTASSVFDDS